QVVYDESFQAFSPLEEQTVLVLVPYASEAASVKFAINRMRQEGSLGEFYTEYVVYQDSELSDEEIKEKIKTADYMILGSEEDLGLDSDAAKEAAEAAMSFGKEAVTAVLCTGLPYQTELYPDLPCIVCYGETGMSEEDAKSGVITGRYGPNIPAAVETIFGVD
ncbi:MAG TPA: hypothetical protein PLU43_08255, partial [Lachnospiraceae bacterium]|nr:hypothetical protein [Lachnospiraceae bacterium]